MKSLSGGGEGGVVLVHLTLLIFQIVGLKNGGSGVVVTGLSFIEQESDGNRARGMSVGNED